MSYNSAAKEPAVEIRNLSIRYRGSNGLAIEGLSLTLEPGECLGIVGESGSGKSTAGLAIMGYLPASAEILSGEVLVAGSDVTKLDRRKRRELRGRRISMVYQSPMTALNPLMTVGDQVAEALTVHGHSKAQAHQATVRLFEQVRMPDPADIGRRYPHQLSGGQLQRVVIAMALSCKPDLIIMDEPTTGLDVTTEAAILSLIDDLRRETGTAILLISHNLGLVAKHADRVAVMLKGCVVEQASARELFANPTHEYTRALLEAVPKIAEPKGGRVSTVKDGAAPTPKETVLGIRSLNVTFPARRSNNDSPKIFKALDHVDLDLHKGEILAIVGESGSGKTTLSRVVAGLHRPDFDSRIDLRPSSTASSDVAMVFQDPTSTLNPARTIGWTLKRTLASAGVARDERADRAAKLLEDVKLPAHYMSRLPRELSGGERQRVSISRALAQNPSVFILDEPTSALDVSVQKSVLNLLLELRDRYELSILFVTHDLGVVRYIADRIAVLYRGELVAVGDVEEVFEKPDHPYVSQLINASMANQMPRRDELVA
ncbi:ABC transporter ATP-binding protein [Rhizobium sp. Root1204]|uniref:dipeptide ABC transporter ATP-binding protein n=1 Tax=Rhizobium sp. Root1204 TaxID=1736428 RepID=UPI000712DE69|nr:ABC transporter ATP-binding protein [Rhizobium sp. Root1204]KQV41212.1 hypothetical protein ASC96_18050 [Rhizobium sp. Root1204]